MKRLQIASTAILITALLFANEVFCETKRWSDVAEFSYVDNQGNTELTSLLLNNTLKYPIAERVTGTWKLHALSASTEGEKTAEKYSTSLRLDYAISDRLYTFSDVSWLSDEFAKIDDRYYFGAGLGYNIIAGPKQTLLTEAGLNYTMDEYTNHTDKKYAGGRAFVKYAYNFNEKNSFEHGIEYLQNFENDKEYNVNSDTSVKSSLNNFLSLKSGYLVKYDNKPSEGAVRTDRMLTATLVVNF